MMIGSLVGGFVHEKYYRHTDLVLSIALAVMATGCYIVPWSTSVPMAAFAFFLNGIGDGLVNTGKTLQISLQPIHFALLLSFHTLLFANTSN